MYRECKIHRTVHHSSEILSIQLTTYNSKPNANNHHNVNLNVNVKIKFTQCNIIMKHLYDNSITDSNDTHR